MRRSNLRSDKDKNGTGFRSNVYEEAAELLDGVRAIMKTKEVGYAELSKRLGMSESGVKKMFLSGDCSISKLGSLCAALEISVSELVHFIESPEPSERRFSPEAERFLCKNPRHFQLFWKLVYERRSVEDARVGMRLSESEVFQFLRKLDSLGLLELHSGGWVRVPRVEIAYFPDGMLMHRLRKELGPQVLEDAMAPDFKDSSFFVINYLKLSPRRRKELDSDLRRVLLEYTRHTVRSLNTRDPSAQDFRLISCIVPGSFYPPETR